MIEVSECGCNFGSVGDEENPSKVDIFINEGNKPPFARGSSDLGQS